MFSCFQWFPIFAISRTSCLCMCHISQTECIRKHLVVQEHFHHLSFEILQADWNFLPSYSHEIYSVFPFSSKRDSFCLKHKHVFSYKTRPENFLSVAADVPPVHIRLFKNTSSLCQRCPTPVINLVYQSEMLYDWVFYNLWHLLLLRDTNDWIDCTHTAHYWPLLETRYKHSHALAGDCH